MKSKWIWTTLGAVPFLAAVVTLQSCGGEGGPIGGDGGGGLPSITQAFLDLMSPEQRTASAVGSERCADGACHGGRAHGGGRGDDPAYTTWLETKHASRGVGCERCHGPGSVHAANPTKSNILTYPKVVSPVSCAQCHGQIYDQWQTSQHSHLITSAITNQISSPNTARTSQCISCHSGLWRTQINSNGINPSTLSDDQIREIAQNTIDHAAFTATCVTCHDPHANTGNLSDDGKEVQLRKTVFNTDTGPIAPGSPSSSFVNFNHLCAQCHNGRGTNPADSALNSSTARPPMHDSVQYQMLMGVAGVEGSGPVIRNTAHANAPGQCSHCHMPGSSHTKISNFDKGCAPCHSAADAAARTNATKTEIIGRLYALRTKMEDWAVATYQNNPNYANVDSRLLIHLWDYSTVITEFATEFGIGTTNIPSNHQANIPIQLKRARYNYYFIVRDGCFGPHNAPYANHLITVANENIDEVFGGGGGALRSPSRGFGLSTAQKLRILEQDKARASRTNATTVYDD